MLVIFAIGDTAGASPPTIKIFVEEPGAYRVAYEDLGSPPQEIASASLGLTVAGQQVPIWIEDGGDGTFGQGDWFEFVGETLPGEASHSSEYSRFNVYLLRTGAPSPARMQSGLKSPRNDSAAHELRSSQHLEDDLLLLRLKNAGSSETEELWYWAKMAHNNKEPFVQELDLGDLDNSARKTVGLSIHLRGWSQPRKKPGSEMADHRINVKLNGKDIGSGEWNGTDSYLIEIPDLPASAFEVGSNSLELAVPRRSKGDTGDALIDVVVLNWIEVDYPRLGRLGAKQAHLRVDDSSPGNALQIASETGDRLVVFGEKGSRWLKEAVAEPGEEGAATQSWAPRAGERSFVATPIDAMKTPAAIVSDRPSRLADTGNRADYIIISHQRLIEAVTPLADFHRSRGLEVEVVDVEDVYDEFNHGILHPQAIRSFLAHAYNDWRKPAPRFVLLVGDASWDLKNSTAVDANYADWTYRQGEQWGFVKNLSTPYSTEESINHRGLIPTWNHSTSQGHAASDNFYVAFDDDSWVPNMAIGRLPVVEPAEVEAIVEKTIRYVSKPEVGAWRRRVLFVTNESKGMQNRSDRLAGLAAGHGFTAEKIYPASSEASNEHHSNRMLELFAEGQAVVHFLGHGGRYIWRTGPPDLKKNHDLFTLDHLEELEVTDRLPIVLSLSCYTAPFDHPTADSIGEKFLRLPKRGAISVVAASWRNSPAPQWGKVLLAELAAPGTTIGEAFMRAKRSITNRMFVETYNLLGDPAVPVAAPQGRIALEVAEEEEGGAFKVQGTLDLQDFSGTLVVDLVGVDGEVLDSKEHRIEAPAFDIRLDRPESEVRAVRAYAWNAEVGIDAAGGSTLGGKRNSEARTDRASRVRKRRFAGGQVPDDEALPKKE